MKREVLALVPKPPETISALDIAKRLSPGEDHPKQDFLKAIQRCLRDLRDEEVAQSCPVGHGTQLGWHLPGIVHADAKGIAETERVPPQRKSTPHSHNAPPLGGRVPHVGLLHKVLALVPMTPGSITSAALADLIEEGSAIPAGQARKAVGTQLRELQLRQLVTAVRRQGSDQLAWCRQ